MGIPIRHKKPKILLPQKVCTIAIEKKIEKYVTNFLLEGKNFFLDQNIGIFIADSESPYKNTYIYSYIICQYYISFRYVS